MILHGPCARRTCYATPSGADLIVDRAQISLIGGPSRISLERIRCVKSVAHATDLTSIFGSNTRTYGSLVRPSTERGPARSHVSHLELVERSDSDSHASGS